ncbi:hypothetical protein [Microbacterium sp. 1P06AB]|uniref:hypothetical protein n=1 Tax=Microbacterium sp. 1P06AB TaxID=3132289 RepID=UPI0039A4DF83
MKAEFEALLAHEKTAPKIGSQIETVVRVNADGKPVRANYVVLSPTVPNLDDERWTSAQHADSTRRFRCDIRFVAVDTIGLLGMVEIIHAHTIGHVLDVPGRTCSAIRLLQGVEEGRVRFDRASQLVYLDETIEFTSQRA